MANTTTNGVINNNTMAANTAPARKLTGFFGLALELRQMVYEELLPESKTLCWDGKKSIISGIGLTPEKAAAIGPDFQGELEAWALKRTKTLSVEISADDWKPPVTDGTFGFSNELENVEIMVSYTQQRPGERIEDGIRRNLTRLGDYLHLSGPEHSFKSIKVGFRPLFQDDWCYYTPYNDGDSEGLLLKHKYYRQGECNKPLLQHALEPLREFPAFRKSKVTLPDSLIREDVEHGVDDGAFGADYLALLKVSFVCGLRGSTPLIVEGGKAIECWEYLDMEADKRTPRVDYEAQLRATQHLFERMGPSFRGRR